MRGIQDGPTIPITWPAIAISALLIGGAALAADEQDLAPAGCTVSVYQPHIAASATVRILDATDATDRAVDQAIASLVSGEVDGVTYDTDTACDNSTDCDRELKAACRRVGGTVDSTTFSARRHQCEGTCSTGHAVTVVCVTP